MGTRLSLTERAASLLVFGFGVITIVSTLWTLVNVLTAAGTEFATSFVLIFWTAAGLFSVWFWLMDDFDKILANRAYDRWEAQRQAQELHTH